MSQFTFANELKNCVRMDEPITKGPIPRWQRKCIEASNLSNTNLNVSKKKASTSFNASLSKTPSKWNVSGESIATKKTPAKTPKKSPSTNSTSRTPSSTKGSKTPNGGDRFIPDRSATNFELGHYKVNQEEPPNDELTSPSQKQIQRIMSENLHGGDVQNMRILSYRTKAPSAPDGFLNPLKVVYSHSKTPSSVKSASRYIPQTPDRILDAPDIIDDYYLNLIDWSPNNILAVALSSNVYLWNAGTGSIQQLLTLEGSDFVCSVSWIQQGNYLAVGTSMGVTQLWDCSAQKRQRIMGGHSARVSSLSWNSYILSSGSRSGRIIHHDVRQGDHNVAELSSHTQEVCGLKWSLDGRYLASGGNDNMLYIWPVVAGQAHSRPQPLYSFSAHQAAVKALAWCPWQSGILMSGGGTADRCIRFWNCNTGTCFSTIDTKSQVCALQWSTTYKEFISGHGYANNQLVIWKYPSMTKVAELTGHSARVLHLAMSPDGSTVLSAGADETLRLWKCFAPDPVKKKKETGSQAASSFKGIR